MGSVFGMSSVKEPPFVVISSASQYEIRRYSSYIIAQVKNGADDPNGAFRILARYIGVFGEPENSVKQAMSMTAPVITVPAKKISMTAPVITDTNSMSFVLPFEYKRIDQVPVPINNRITLKEIPERKVAVYTFSGWYEPAIGNQHLKSLLSNLRSHKILKDSTPDEVVEWSVAQYNPPFTIPMLRRNEIWVELSNEAADDAK